MGFGETRTANQRSREICNFVRHLMSELLLVGNMAGREKKKSGLRRKLKVSILDIQIKRSGLKVFRSALNF